MHFIVLIVIFIVVLWAIAKQLKIKAELKQQLLEMESYLPSSTEYEKVEYEDGTVAISIYEDEPNYVIEQLNDYLRANSGVAPNFEIIKDIVERYSSELDETIRTLMPIPLYYGLCGTIFGIIFGLVPLAVGSSVGVAVSSVDDLLQDIPYLLGGVALAMLGSLVGVLITASVNTTYKEISREHEAGKNRFYSWFQIEMLPVMNANPSGPLGQLTRSLADFNNSFKVSAHIMLSTASQIQNTFRDQKDLLELMKELNSSNIAHENVKMASQMGQHIQVIKALNDSIFGMKDYVEKVQEVTNELKSSTEYIQTVQSLTKILSSQEEAIQISVARQTKQATDIMEKQEEYMSRFLNEIKQQNSQIMSDFEKTLTYNADKMEKFLKENTTLPQAIEATSKIPQVFVDLTHTLQKIEQGQNILIGYIKDGAFYKSSMNNSGKSAYVLSNGTKGETTSSDQESIAYRKSFMGKVKSLFTKRKKVYGA